MSAPEFFLKRNDSGAVLEAVCRDSASARVNIDGATVRFRMAPIQGGDTVVDAAADNDQNTTDEDTWGDVSYTFTATDTDQDPGLYLGEFEVTYALGEVITYPNAGYVLILVTQDIAVRNVTS